MRILITGGSGFIGKALCSFLLKKNHKLILLTRNSKKTLKLFSKSFNSIPKSHLKTYTWNMEEGPPCPQALENLDAVIHLGGAPIAEKRWNKKWKEKIYKTRVDGTKNLIHGLEKSNSSLTTLISASAIGFYGCSKKDEILTEASPQSKRKDDFLSHLCFAWESEINKAFKKHPSPPRKIILRISNVLGQKGGILAKLKTPFRLGLGASLGSGKQHFSWIHIEDLIRLISFCLETQNLEGSINASSPHPVTNLKFTKTLSSTLNRRTFLKIPSFALFILAGEITKYLLSSLSVISEKIEKKGFRFKYPSLEEALKEIYSQSCDF